MTAKKKRLLFMVLGVFICALAAVLIGDRAMLDNKKEYAERCSEFAGIWTDKDKKPFFQHIQLNLPFSFL